MSADKPLKIWMPYTVGGSGSDVSTHYLAQGLRGRGHDVIEQPFDHRLQYVPDLLRLAKAPAGARIAVTNSWSGFAFARPALSQVTVERLFVAGAAGRSYRSRGQAIYHDWFVGNFVARSYRVADAVVCMSEASAAQIRSQFTDLSPRLILNAVDTGFFCPSAARKEGVGSPVRILFVGNLTRRKGVELLPPVMEALGQGFELVYTTGLRETADPLARVPNARPLGRLSQEEVREAYRDADLLILPARLEGFPRAVMEAQACGTPAIVSDASSLPESVEHGVTGYVCDGEDPASYAAAVRSAVSDPDRYRSMRSSARRRAEERHSLDRMVLEYEALFYSLLSQR